MDWSRVPVFLKVVETGSFTAAAKALGVPKSSASRGVAALEQALQTQLLQRTTRELKLTDSGRTFYERARGAMAALEEAKAELTEHTDDAQGVVRLTIPSETWPLPELLARFVKLHPKIHVELVVSNRHLNLIEEGVDLALRAGKLEDSTLVARKIATSHLGLYASPGYLKRRPAPKTFAQVAEHDVVMFRGKQGKARLKLQGPNGDEEVEVRGRVSTDDLATARGLIAAGLGIGLLPIFLEKCGTRNAQFERVLPQYALKGGGVHLVMPSARYVPTRVRLLSDFLAEHFLSGKCEFKGAASSVHAPARPARRSPSPS
ncbi:MAG: LysR family transcriptional regulator [Archangium sp.]|nr:LysR family transcriptional regulator [Archangium sp.]MDP3151862.1 LysR family transcriptional regulator [Archangium sp.]MDP3574393.1 LysR family transcriptional regulator [Archangium sp.]